MTEAIRSFLLCRDLSADFVDEILEKGVTDEVIRQLECKGFSYDDIVNICKALKEIEHSCHCSTSSEEDRPQANVESDYLRDHFGHILPMALREIITKKPCRPIEYLGQWLLHYRDCDERERRRQEFEAELLEERAKYPQPICPSPQDYGEEEAEEEHEGHKIIINY